jgi:WhiB family redox-sensing transcriptional regulator
LAEQEAVNFKVPGSSPGGPAKGGNMSRRAQQLYVELTEQIVGVGEVPCQQAPDIFFIDKGDPIGPEKIRMSKTLCADCPVQMLCLEYALEAKERDGIWGGLTRNERDALKRNRIVNERVY